MQTKLAEAALMLEERMQRSSLHKMHASYLIGTGHGDPTIANFFFRNLPHMEKARRLETAYSAGLITTENFCEALSSAEV